MNGLDAHSTALDGLSSSVNHFIIFYQRYNMMLTAIEEYLKTKSTCLDTEFSHIYDQWHDAVHILRKSVFLKINNIPLPSGYDLKKVLMMFSFAGAAQFLRDIAKGCGLELAQNWIKEFQMHIQTLLQLHNQQAEQMLGR